MIILALKTEWLKAKNSLTFRIFTLIFLLSVIGSLLFIRALDLPEELIGGSPLDAENIYLFAGYAYNWILFLLGGILAIRLITLEFSNKTWRAAVMTGVKRWELWAHKLIFMVLLTLIAGSIFLISCFVTASFYSGAAASIPGLSVLVRTFLITYAYLMFGAMIAWLFRRNTASIMLYLGYILFLEPVIRWWIHGKLITGNHPSMHYYPMNAVEDLFPNPLIILKDVTIQMGAVQDELLRNLVLSHSTAVLLTSLYMIVFLIVSYLAIRKVNL